MPSSINGLRPPLCPTPDASAQNLADLPDDVVLNILEQADLPPDRLLPLRQVSKQFKKVCEADALWRPWWSCGPRAPEGDGIPSTRYHDLMGQSPGVRKDLAELWRLKGKQRSDYENTAVAVIARRHLDNQRVFFLAVELNPMVLEFAPPQWLEDDAAMKRAIVANRLVLGYAPQRFREDPALLAKALRAPSQKIDKAKIWQTDDAQLILEAIRDVGPEVIVHAARALQDDVDFMAQAVAIHSLCLKYATGNAVYALDLPLQAWREDSQAMARAIAQNGDMLKYAPEPMRQKRDVLVAALKSCWKAIEYAPDWARADADLILEVLTPEGIYLLEKVAASLKSDRCFMDRALDVDPRCLRFAAKALLGDRELILKSVRLGYFFILNFASAQVRDDEELMLEAVQLKGSTLQYASERLGAKKAFVLHAVNQDGYALGHAAQALWADRDLVLASYRGKAAFLGRMSTWSEKDWDRFREGLSIIGYRDDIPAELREDPEVVVAYYAFRACTMVNMEEYIFLPKKLTGDGELIAQLLDLKVFLPLWSLSRAVRSNRALALRAIRLLASNLKYAAAALRNDPSFVLEAFALNAYCLRYAPRWMLNHKPFMLKACQMHEIALRWASPRLQKDPEVVARAVQYHPDAIQYAAWALYEEFVRAHPAARVPEHVGEGRDSVTSDSSDDGFWQRQSWSKTRAAGRSVANSRFALKALLRRAVTGKL